MTIPYFLIIQLGAFGCHNRVEVKYMTNMSNNVRTLRTFCSWPVRSDYYM